MQIFSTNSKSGDIQVHNSKKVQSFKFQLNQGKIKDFRYFHGFHFIRKVPLFSMKMIYKCQKCNRNPKKVLSFEFQPNQSKIEDFRLFHGFQISLH